MVTDIGTSAHERVANLKILEFVSDLNRLEVSRPVVN